MRVSAPGFVSERLRDALSIRDLTGADLARAIGISPHSVSRYINGTGPEPHTLVRIANELRLPEAYFLRSMPAQAATPTFFRSMTAATKRARMKAAVRLRWLREAWDYLHRYVEFPKNSFPVFNLPSDPTAIADEEVEQIAEEMRHRWALGSGPIANVVALIEYHGGIVSRLPLGAAKLDALSTWAVAENRPFLMLNSDKRTAVRSRFDAAHELGHMLIHRNIDSALLNRPEVFKLVEQQAHRFAGAFLLPSDTFGRSVYVPTLSALLVQKRVWNVSIAAMLRRMRQLELISAEQVQRVWQSYSRSGMRLREPLDDELPIETPELVRRASELVMGERRVSRDQFLSTLPFDSQEMQNLLALPIEFNHPTRQRVTQLVVRAHGRHLVSEEMEVEEEASQPASGFPDGPVPLKIIR